MHRERNADKGSATFLEIKKRNVKNKAKVCFPHLNISQFKEYVHDAFLSLINKVQILTLVRYSMLFISWFKFPHNSTLMFPNNGHFIIFSSIPCIFMTYTCHSLSSKCLLSSNFYSSFKVNFLCEVFTKGIHIQTIL